MVNTNNKKGMIVVVSAPSGAGKTSLLFEVLKRHPEMGFSVSATTRPPREGEREGVNYHFLSNEEFETTKKNGKFLEWNVVYGNQYGTLKENVEKIITRGGIVILDTDTVGAFHVRELFPDAVLIFILPPSSQVLEDRLTKRDTENPEHISARLEAAPREIAQMEKFDYIVINDDLNRAVSEVSTIIEAEKLKSSRMTPVLLEWRNYCNG